MTSATVDRSEFRHILLSGTIVGAVTGAAVVLFVLVSRSGLLPAGIVSSLPLMLIVGAVVAAGRGARGGGSSVRSLASPAVLGGLSAGLGLGLAGVLLMPVAAGAGFVLTLVIYALVVLARKG